MPEEMIFAQMDDASFSRARMIFSKWRCTVLSFSCRMNLPEMHFFCRPRARRKLGDRSPESVEI